MLATHLLGTLLAGGLLTSLADEVPPTDRIELRLLIVDEDLQPVAGAVIDIWNDAADAGATPHLSAWERRQLQDSPEADRNPRDEASTPDATFRSAYNGHAVLELPSESAVFVASKEGVGGSGVWFGEAVADEADGRVTVMLREGGFVGGTVLNADGTPAAGVAVTFRKAEHAGWMDWYGDGAGRAIARCPPSVRTDEEGRFETLTDPGFHGPAFAVAEDGTRSSIEDAMSLSTPGPHTTLRFPGRFRVRGVAVGPDGTQLPGVELMFSRPLHKKVTTMTDEAGSFDVDLFAPGTFGLAVDTARNSVLIMDGPLRVTLTEEAPEVEIEAAFVATAMLRGRVVAPELDQHKYASVRASPEPNPDRPLSFSQSLELGVRVRLAPDGTFAIPAHPHWSYRLECVLNNPMGLSQVREGVTAGGEEIVFEFAGRYLTGGSIEGTVVDADTGASLADPFVVLKRVMESPALAVLDDREAHATNLAAKDSYEFSGVVINHLHALEVSASGYATAMVGPIDISLADDRRVIGLHRVAQVTVQLPELVGALQEELLPTLRHLVVLYPDTAPMPTQPFFRLVQTVPIEGDGPIVLRDLRPGPLALQLFEGRTPSPLIELQLAAGSHGTAEPGPPGSVGTGSLVVEARDRFDRPIAGVQIQPFWNVGNRDYHPGDAAAYRLVGQTDAQGRVAFNGLTEGIWHAAFDDSDIAIGFPVSVVVRPGETSSVIIREQ